jgi:hypothetical protein
LRLMKNVVRLYGLTAAAGAAGQRPGTAGVVTLG